MEIKYSKNHQIKELKIVKKTSQKTENKKRRDPNFKVNTSLKDLITTRTHATMTWKLIKKINLKT